MRGTRAWFLLAAATLTAACGATTPTVFQREARAAERAYAAGRYREAAGAWQRAAEGSGVEHERDEARYRRARSLLRGGSREEARVALEELLHTSSRGRRAARAAYDLVILRCEEDASSCRDGLEAFLRQHASSGLSRPALARLVGGFRDDEGNLLRSRLDSLQGPLEGTPVLEDLRHAAAHSLYREGNLERARDRFLEAARLHPYPRGARWDDALWYAAEIELRRGQPRLAIAHLERMLGAREPSLGNGSYERPRYGEARFRIGEIWRDALGDPKRAQAEFDDLFREHPTSRLRDDAIYAAAVIARDSGDPTGACRRVHALFTTLPESRYAACGHELCASALAGKKACSPYLTRSAPRRGLPEPDRAPPRTQDD